MKLLLFFLLLSLSAIGQSKNDNQIIITIPDSAAQAYVKLITVLQDGGYDIEKADPALLTIQTDFRQTGKRAVTMRINAYIRNNAIHLQGKYSFDGSEGTAEFYGSEAGVPKTAFRSLEQLAKAYPEGVITYAKK